MFFFSYVAYTQNSAVLLQFLLESFQIRNGFELCAVDEMLLFDSEEIPYSSSDDLDWASDKCEEIFVAE